MSLKWPVKCFFVVGCLNCFYLSVVLFILQYWLDLEKPLSRQIGLSLIDTLVRFCVKFYTPDPSQLEEEFTRYLFCLQIKRDLSQGLLQCNNNTAALMASYIVQGMFIFKNSENQNEQMDIIMYPFTSLQALNIHQF